MQQQEHSIYTPKSHPACQKILPFMQSLTVRRKEGMAQNLQGAEGAKAATGTEVSAKGVRSLGGLYCNDRSFAACGVHQG